MKRLRLSEEEKDALLIANNHFLVDYIGQGGPRNERLKVHMRLSGKLNSHLHYLEFKEDYPA